MKHSVLHLTHSSGTLANAWPQPLYCCWCCCNRCRFAAIAATSIAVSTTCRFFCKTTERNKTNSTSDALLDFDNKHAHIYFVMHRKCGFTLRSNNSNSFIHLQSSAFRCWFLRACSFSFVVLFCFAVALRRFCIRTRTHSRSAKARIDIILTINKNHCVFALRNAIYIKLLECARSRYFCVFVFDLFIPWLNIQLLAEFHFAYKQTHI